MVKQKFFDMKNLVRGLKGLGTSVVTSIIMLIPTSLARYLIVQQQMMVIGLIVGLSTLLLYFTLWGYLAKRMWSWN